MPLLVPCEELKPGMCLKQPLLWRGRVMLAAGDVLTTVDINSLRMRFPKHSLCIADPALDDAIDFENDSYEREVARKAQRIIADSMSEVQERFTTHPSLDGVSLHGIDRAVTEVIEYLRSHPVSAVLLDNIIHGKHYLSERAGSIFYLSLLLGGATREYINSERKRQSSAQNLTPRVTQNLAPLGLGAMLLDLGMLPLRHLFTETEALTPQTWQQIRQHPITGASMLPEDFSSTAKMIVRTHHENLDGTGYPQEFAGEKLHVFTRIIRIVDAYEAATARRIYKEAKSRTRTLWEMSAGPYQPYYDQNLMRTFIQLVQPFPVGAKIRLVNQQYAVVVKYNRRDPLSPQIVIAFDSRNRRIPNHQLEGVRTLGESPEFRAASFEGEDLAYLYENESWPLRASRVGVWPSLFEAAYP